MLGLKVVFLMLIYIEPDIYFLPDLMTGIANARIGLRIRNSIGKLSAGGLSYH